MEMSVTGGHSNLVLFQDAMEHCCRIARILRAERGYGLLVGVAGMGKKTVARLATHLNDSRFAYICTMIFLKNLR